MTLSAIPKSVRPAIDDMIDNCYEIKRGQKAVIAAQTEGLQGGDNRIDRKVVDWLIAACAERGALAKALWFDHPDRYDGKAPAVLVEALKENDVFIDCSFDITWEEYREFRNITLAEGKVFCRLAATTPELLSSRWASTPYELQSEIRYQATVPFGNGGADFLLDTPNGTHVEGIILPPNGYRLGDPEAPVYAKYRKDQKSYRPFPEWVTPPVNIGNANGNVVFDRTLSWWSSYLGIDPTFEQPVRLTIENGRTVSIEGGREADVIRAFMDSLVPIYGDAVYQFGYLHLGMHPFAAVEDPSRYSPGFVRFLDHSNASTLHMHVCEVPPTDAFTYRVHLTCDVKNATLRVGDQYITRDGRLLALDHPDVKERFNKYGIQI
ncbi:MAG: hypothetical protein LBN36_09275 [Clostridiales Family XIII bacterium]|nr:hypothetical protein [Clostridiales Family XIII bacterium]